MVGTIAVVSLLLTRQDSPSVIKPLQAKTVEQETVTIPDSKAKATVLVFLLTDCPIANRYGPELKRIEKDYEKKGVSFYRVYVYRDATLETIAEHTKDFEYKWPAIHDSSRTIVEAVDARVTPETVIVLPNGTVAYKGRIDDMYVEHGRLRESGFRRDLRLALDEVLAGKPVTLPRTTALGCFIDR